MVTLVIDHAAKRETSTHPHEHGPAPVNTKPSPERVAMGRVTVHGVAISRKAIAAEVQNFPARNPGEGWREATRALVIRELLLQECARLDIQAEQMADADGRVETEEDARVRALFEREVAVPQANEDALRRFYDNNSRRFMTSPLFEADHILLAARRNDKESFAAALSKATALADILAKEPDRFDALARDHSACPSASVGGNLGQISKGDTTPEFEAALVALAAGEISKPVETRYGIHLIRMRRRIDGRQMPFEAVRDRIRDYLHDHVRQQATRQYIEQLIGRADIQGLDLNGSASPLVQ